MAYLHLNDIYIRFIPKYNIYCLVFWVNTEEDIEVWCTTAQLNIYAIILYYSTKYFATHSTLKKILEGTQSVQTWLCHLSISQQHQSNEAFSFYKTHLHLPLPYRYLLDQPVASHPICKLILQIIQENNGSSEPNTKLVFIHDASGGSWAESLLG